jgi:cbb3-type cytochrome oxidase subunit 3
MSDDSLYPADTDTGDGDGEFDPNRNAEHIERLRELSGEIVEYSPRLLVTVVLLAGPYLLVKFGPSVSNLTFSQELVNTVALATAVFEGLMLLIVLLLVGLFVACRVIAWWVERRDERKAARYGRTQ